MTLSKHLIPTLEEKGRTGVLFRRLPNCWCGRPVYETAPKPIVFVPTRPNRWKPL